MVVSCLALGFLFYYRLWCSTVVRIFFETLLFYLYSNDYLEDKKKARQAKLEEKNRKMDRKKAAIISKMTNGALLEISGLPELSELLI